MYITTLTDNNQYIILILYVDDIMLTGDAAEKTNGTGNPPPDKIPDICIREPLTLHWFTISIHKRGHLHFPRAQRGAASHQLQHASIQQAPIPDRWTDPRPSNMHTKVW